MTKTVIATGVVHKVPNDLRDILTSTPKMATAWNDLTPLARNEWLCWILSAQKEDTRKGRIERAREDLLKGKRRPCCWMGCTHRTDKKVSPSQEYILKKIGKGKQ